MRADRQAASLRALRPPRAYARDQVSPAPLVGRRLPSVSLEGDARGLQLAELALVHGLVVYVYPGSERSPGGEDVPRMDAIMHRAFRAAARTLLNSGFHVLGISSQAQKAQRRAVICHRLEHQMLSDPSLLLARELGLPTFSTGQGCWYERLVLVVTGGSIAWALFPVRAPVRAPAQALAWIRTHESEEITGCSDAS